MAWLTVAKERFENDLTAARRYVRGLDFRADLMREDELSWHFDQFEPSGAALQATRVVRLEEDGAILATVVGEP